MLSTERKQQDDASVVLPDNRIKQVEPDYFSLAATAM